MTTDMKQEIREAIALRFANLLKTLPDFRDQAERSTDHTDRFMVYERAETIMREAFGFWGQHPVLEQLTRYEHPGIEKIRSATGGDNKAPTCVYVDDDGVIRFSPKLTIADPPSHLFTCAASDASVSRKAENRVVNRTKKPGEMYAPYSLRIQGDSTLDTYLSGKVIGLDAPFPSEIEEGFLKHVRTRWFLLTNSIRWRLYRVHFGKGGNLESFSVVVDVDLLDQNLRPEHNFNKHLGEGDGDFYIPFLFFTPEWLAMPAEDQLKWVTRPDRAADNDTYAYSSFRTQETPRAEDIFGWLSTPQQRPEYPGVTGFLSIAEKRSIQDRQRRLHAYLKGISDYRQIDDGIEVGDHNLAAVIHEIMLSTLGYSSPPSEHLHGERTYHVQKPNDDGFIKFCISSYMEPVEDISRIIVSVEDPKITHSGDRISRCLQRMRPVYDDHDLTPEQATLLKASFLPNVVICTDGLSWDIFWISKAQPDHRVCLRSLKLNSIDSEDADSAERKWMEVFSLVGNGQVHLEAFDRLDRTLAPCTLVGREHGLRNSYGESEDIKQLYALLTFRISDLFSLNVHPAVDPFRRMPGKALFGDTYPEMGAPEMLSLETKVKRMLLEDFTYYMARRRVKYPELQHLLHNSGQADSWDTDLNTKGMYLVTDRSNGKEYVCEAVAERTIRECWMLHAKNGHANNAEIKELLDKMGPAHVSYLEFSVLETSTDGSIGPIRVSYWKELLAKRAGALDSLKKLVGIN